jgi:3-methyladenine DNA glycosylase/8-oxoguanine DNA glycosylase
MNNRQLIRKNGDGTIEIVTLEQINGVDMLEGQHIRRRRVVLVKDVKPVNTVIVLPTVESLKRRPLSRCRRCLVHGLEFDTIVDAARHFNIGRMRLAHLLRTGAREDMRYL